MRQPVQGRSLRGMGMETSKRRSSKHPAPPAGSQSAVRCPRVSKQGISDGNSNDAASPSKFAARASRFLLLQHIPKTNQMQRATNSIQERSLRRIPPRSRGGSQSRSTNTTRTEKQGNGCQKQRIVLRLTDNLKMLEVSGCAQRQGGNCRVPFSISAR
jgi:hypothetical protein